ncbi:polysaccharide biosynthesis tyrosine autokinase [Geomonas terrae]|uniref:Polysaccharide biosynthesis tyrosine autokinase n=1 Tax=Geomonas terrae TaxID=2562681 RepID=A0A4S1CAW7_9BACT|nr:XrtA-associated tyrosine autokinase [Geomonas terrae]TGU70468.1 polysaccharide biosynthesis tyrosine autokinase [Geomonas terrae]TGU72888.1 polysaccharide biosynthesis tyrosine autokinase [Geomonas terrae]
MSRIEMAMEKAARLREEGAPREAAEGSGTTEVATAAPPGNATRVATAPPAVPPERVLMPRHPFLVNILDPHSPAAEEYRKLKSVLVKLTDGDRFKNSIMVTSSVPGEGKSLTALNLAASLAQGLDHTVLLVDADLRRPSLHKYLEIEQGPGLADILSGKAEIPDTIVQTGLGKLSLIRSGGHVENPVELFSSQKMRALVDELKNRYPDRYIIFDTPPLLPFAESRALANIVDGVLLVVMERLASEEEVLEAYESVKGPGLLGVVYNAACESGNDERYAYYKHYQGQGQ